MSAISEANSLSRPLLEAQTVSLIKKGSAIPVKDEGHDHCERTNVTGNLDRCQVKENCDPVLDIVINNVVCSFNLRCHLNLKHIALNGYNVEYRRENGMVTMKLRNPCTTASIWSSGKITCTGATSDADAKKASRRFARMIQQLGFKVKFANFRIVNVLGTCMMPFGIKISQFSAMHPQNASYEPELHPGVTYKIKEIKATLKIFSTGNITITAPSIENVQKAVECIFPLVHEHRKERLAQIVPFKNQVFPPERQTVEEEEGEEMCDNLGETGDSDVSWD